MENKADSVDSIFDFPQNETPEKEEVSDEAVESEAEASKSDSSGGEVEKEKSEVSEEGSEPEPEEEIDVLRKRLEEIASSKIQELTSVPEVNVEKPSKEAAGDFLKKFNESLSADVKFLSDEEIEQIIDNPHLIHKAINQARRKTAEEIISIVPVIVDSMIERYDAAQKVVNDFYAKNSDLLPYRNYVAMKFKMALSSAKDVPYDKLLDSVANDVRKDLHLGKKSNSKQTTKPVFAGVKKEGGGRAPADVKGTKKPTQADYISEILNLSK